MAYTARGFPEKIPTQSANDNTCEDARGTSPSNVETGAASTSRSGALSLVDPALLPASRRVSRRPTMRMSKPELRKSMRSPVKRSRSKVALHKVLTSIFNHASSRDGSQPDRGQGGSGSVGARPRGMSLYESLPSLEVISPGAFIFSGPSLKSACSGSRSNSTSCLQSLAENGSEAFSLYRRRTGSLSIGSASLFDDGVLEPFVEHGVLCSIPGILSGERPPLEEVTKVLSCPDNDSDNLTMTDVLLHMRDERVEVGVAIAALLLPYLDFELWKALRATCRTWSTLLNILAPPKFPASYHVPVEILQYIFGYLAPRDFNAARHTCRNWMRASLNKTQLIAMLGRGGWSRSVQSGVNRTKEQTEAASSPVDVSGEWDLSQQLSRECALSANWTGNGISRPHTSDPIYEVVQIDFSDLANGPPSLDEQSGASLVFSTSICGKLLLVARETLIFVYALHDTTLHPVTRVTCPRRVLSMSMDATSGRNAVAALLEGRMGMVCEVRFGRNVEDGPVDIHVETHTDPYRTTTRASVFTSGTSNFEAGVDFANHTSAITQGCPSPPPEPTMRSQIRLCRRPSKLRCNFIAGHGRPPYV